MLGTPFTKGNFLLPRGIEAIAPLRERAIFHVLTFRL